MIHDLKCWPEYFKAVKSGIKPFEYRKDDRGYAVGDTLHLREYDPETEQYTGDEIDKTVTYILPTRKFAKCGDGANFVIMGLAPRDWTPCAEGLPTTGEIVRALRNCADATGKRKPCTPECCFFNKTNCCAESLYSSAADRLESQEQKLELLNGGDFDVIDIPAALAYLESVEEILPHASALIDLIQSLKGTAIELTARAEQAEKERDALVKSVDRLVEAWENFKSPALIELVKQWRGQPQEGEGK